MMRTRIAWRGMVALLPVVVLLQACSEAPHDDSHDAAASVPEADPQLPISQGETATSPLSPVDQPRTAEAATAALNAYRFAAASKDGTRAVEYLHPSYFEMTARQIDAALDADATAVASMDTMDRFMVYALRFRLEPQELRTLTPKALAALAIDRGWIDDEVTGAATVSDVRLLTQDSATPDRALVSLEFQGTPVDAPIPVSYHEGRWLVDLAAMMGDAGKSLERMADQFDLSIDEFIKRALMAVEGKPMPDDIDQPVGRN